MFLLIFATSLSAFFLFHFRKGPFYLNPLWLFVFTQLVVIVGSISLLDTRSAVDRRYAVVLASFIISTMAGALVATSQRSNSQLIAMQWLHRAPRLAATPKLIAAVYMFIGMSVFVSTMYFVAVGFNFFVDGVIALVRGNSLGKDVSGMRLSAYAGESYFAPGYVNQFKNTILPLLNAFLVIIGLTGRKKIHFYVGRVLLPITAIFLVGTGQRGPLVLAALMMGCFFAASGVKASRRQGILVGAATLVLFAVGSVLNERVEQSSSLFAAVQEAVNGILYRVFYANQFGGVEGFRFISQADDIQWGRDWYYSFLSILPGQQTNHIPIASRIHAYLFGSFRGTSPLTVPGTCWYNFGWWGITLVPFVIGVIWQSLYLRLLKGPKHFFRILIYAGLANVLGFWIAGDPKILLDNGLPGILLLIFMYAVDKRSRRSLDAAASPQQRTSLFSP